MNHSKTNAFDRVYGERPHGAVWESRLRRSKLNAAEMRPVLYRCLHYCVRAWARPTLQQPVVVADSTAPQGVKTVLMDAWQVWHMRRDGKVTCSGFGVLAENLRFEDEVQP